jgi:hypothetical protein
MKELQPSGGENPRLRSIQSYLDRHGFKAADAEEDFSDPSRPISVVMPALNEEEMIGSAITSIAEAGGIKTEILVVDNGSTDRTKEIVTSLQTSVQTPVVLLECLRPGAAKAVKLGIGKIMVQHLCHDPKAEHKRYIVLQNADTTVPLDWLDDMHRTFQETGADMVTGSYKYPPWVDERIEEGTGIPNLFGRVADFSLFLMQSNLSAIRTSGVNTGIEMASYAGIDGFNEASEESPDWDLGERMRRVGRIALTSAMPFTSPRRALSAIIQGVDYSASNFARLDVRIDNSISDEALLDTAMQLTPEQWLQVQKVCENLVMYAGITHPALKGDFDIDNLRRAVGRDNPFVMQLDAALNEKKRAELQGHPWDHQTIASTARRVAFDSGQAFAERIIPMLGSRMG